MSTATLIPLIVLFLQLILFAISMFYFGQKVATKDDIRDVKTEIGNLRNELRKEISDSRSEISEVRAEVNQQIGSVREELSKLNQNHIDHLTYHQ